MTEPLPSSKRNVKHVPLLIFTGNTRAAYRYARNNGYLPHEYREVRHASHLAGLKLTDYFVIRIAEWNLNHDVSQAWGLYLERLKKQGGALRDVEFVGPKTVRS